MTAPYADSGWFYDRCPEGASRAAKNDEEFWEQVNRNLGLAPDVVGLSDDADQDRLDGLTLADPICPICGSHGACSYDAEGQPLIHATIEVDL